MMHGYGLSPLGGLGMNSYFGLGGWLIPVGFGLLLVIGLVVWFAYANRTHPYAHPSTYAPQGPVAPEGPLAPQAPAPLSDSAETIVRERFARGEIDRDEYDRLIVGLHR